MRVAVLLLSSICCSQLGLTQNAETNEVLVYQGFVAGVYPVRLALSPNSPTGTVRFRKQGAPIAVVGGCDAGDCAYRALDTALSLTFTLVDGVLTGMQRDGVGSERALSAAAVAPEVPFVTVCRSGKWLRTWTNTGTVVTLAALADGRVLGSLHLEAIATSFALSGNLSSGSEGQLQVAHYGGEPIGTIALKALSGWEEATELGVSLQLDGSQQEQVLALTTNLLMGCYQAGGKYDLLYPLAPTQRGSNEIAARVSGVWKQMAKLGPTASGWFEPTRVDEELISGWLHLQGTEGARSYAVNLNPRSGRSIKSTVIVGPRKGRSSIRSAARQRAIAGYPLRELPSFQSWVEDQDFMGFAVVEEGVAYASDLHPVYGQLRYVEPWSTFSRKREVPNWLNRSSNGRR